jgi:sugar transferase (PEP-CTERM/EpsH1 system associated)
VAHVIHRLAVGGLENGLVNLLDRMPADRYRHVIISLTDTTAFRERLQRSDVPVFALHKAPGRGLGVHRRLWQLLRALRPQLVHTRNLPAMEHAWTAALAGVPGRVHGEHGRDVYDLDGSSMKYNLLRRMVRPAVHHYVAVSAELAEWLVRLVGVEPARVTRICNGVDMERFRPAAAGGRAAIGPEGFAGPGTTVIGTVGRMEPVKDSLTLVQAFVRLVEGRQEIRHRARLVMVGAGSLQAAARDLLRKAGVEGLAWLPGERADVPELMRGFDVFVLPSLREGISNTILEAMASGLPVVATRVGGNVELVVDGETGALVPPADPASMAVALQTYVEQPDRARDHGRAARRRVERQFGMPAMVRGYLSLYDAVLAEVGR